MRRYAGNVVRDFFYGGPKVNLWNRGPSGGDRDPNDRVTKRQLLIRFAFYVVLFAVLIRWLMS